MPDPTGRVSHIDEMHRGQTWKRAVRVATTANITLSGTQTIDGVAVVVGDRVLVKNQSTGSQNGIYVCAAGAWSRAYDMDQDHSSSVPAEEEYGAVIRIVEGTANAGTLWGCTTTGTITLGSTALTFTELTGTAVIPDGTYVLADQGGEEVVQVHGATGATETIDLANGNWHAMTLDANCTLTLTGATASVGCSIVVEVTQDATGGRTLTFPAAVANGSSLTSAQVTTANTVSFLTLLTRDGGTTWYGFWAGGGTVVAALDDLSDVTITSPATADRLRYDGSVWRNSALIWRPLTVYDGTNYLPLVDGDGNQIIAEA